MIEIASCMNDLSAGAVWALKEDSRCVVRLVSVWSRSEGSGSGVGFEIWDRRSDSGSKAWETSATMDSEKFLEEYEYFSNHVLNEAREAAKVQYAIERTLSNLSDCFDVEMRMEGREMLQRLVKLAKLSAGYDVLTSEWDEGCAGVGCCADTAEQAGDLLVDQNAFSAGEIAKIVSHDTSR